MECINEIPIYVKRMYYLNRLQQRSSTASNTENIFILIRTLTSYGTFQHPFNINSTR